MAGRATPSTFNLDALAGDVRARLEFVEEIAAELPKLRAIIAVMDGQPVPPVHPQGEIAKQYPYDDGDVTVIAPECFVDDANGVLSYKSENYVPQARLNAALQRHQSDIESMAAKTGEIQDELIAANERLTAMSAEKSSLEGRIEELQARIAKLESGDQAKSSAAPKTPPAPEPKREEPTYPPATPTEDTVLDILREKGECSVARLAGYLSVQLSEALALVDSLARQGKLTKSRDSDNIIVWSIKDGTPEAAPPAPAPSPSRPPVDGDLSPALAETLEFIDSIVEDGEFERTPVIEQFSAMKANAVDMRLQSLVRKGHIERIPGKPGRYRRVSAEAPAAPADEEEGSEERQFKSPDVSEFVAPGPDKQTRESNGKVTDVMVRDFIQKSLSKRPFSTSDVADHFRISASTAREILAKLAARDTIRRPEGGPTQGRGARWVFVTPAMAGIKGPNVRPRGEPRLPAPDAPEGRGDVVAHVRPKRRSPSNRVNKANSAKGFKVLPK